MTEWLLDGIGIVRANELGVTFTPVVDGERGEQFVCVATEARSLAMALLDAADSAAEAFHCTRCDQDKKAKAKATRVLANGSTDVICNGCYGNILSRRTR